MTLEITLGRTNAKLTRARRISERADGYRGFEVSVRGAYITVKHR
jgi:hypothetical protein